MTKRIKFLGIGAGFVVGAACVFGGVLWIAASISNGHRAELKRRCSAKLKTLGSVVAIYAARYNDQLPVFAKSGGSWMCDQPPDWESVGAPAGAVIGKLSFADVSYCPANARQTPAVLWGGPAAPYRVTGYVWTNERPGMPPLTGLRVNPPLGYHKKSYVIGVRSFETELALDWIISDTPGVSGATWTGITAAGRPGIYDTSHLAGKRPDGGNILMLDGHVEWREFDPTKATAVPQTPGGPSFWFPGN
jgi:prepilin-type processing-associated H-X9-DG protein